MAQFPYYAYVSNQLFHNAIKMDENSKRDSFSSFVIKQPNFFTFTDFKVKFPGNILLMRFKFFLSLQTQSGRILPQILTELSQKCNVKKTNFYPLTIVQGVREPQTVLGGVNRRMKSLYMEDVTDIKRKVEDSLQT